MSTLSNLHKAIPTKRATDKVVMEFLEEKFITRFGGPTKIIIMMPRISIL
jgi:hypothetical protein